MRGVGDWAPSEKSWSGGEAGYTCVELDFATKKHRAIGAAEAQAAMDGGKFIWLDVDLAAGEVARKVLELAKLGTAEIVEDALSREPATQLARHEDFLHLVLTGCRLEASRFALERVDAVLGERFLITLHKGSTVFLSTLRRTWLDDFVRFAQSPSFLLYELWDCLLDNYLAVQKVLEERVEKTQAQLTGEVDDRLFKEATELGAELLHLRKVVLPARAVLTDLSTRKSRFVSEATQPYLSNMVGVVERVLQDVLTDRDILAGSLSNYMSLVAHRTNRVMSKLTVVSIIFLPLTFLCGVYGMNFEVLPELRWQYGYGGFWGLVLAIVLGLLWFMRKNRLL